MASRRGPGGGSWSSIVAFGLGAAVALLALWLARDLWRPGPAPGRPERSAELALRDLVGELAVGGSIVSVPDRRHGLELRDRIRRVARQHPEKLEVVAEAEAPGGLRVTLRVGTEVYPVELRWPETPLQPPAARIAIVIDDLGRSVDEARAFLDLGIEITPAVLPHLPHSADVAQLVTDRGRAPVLHLPMEPQGYPKVQPGPGALLRGMSEAEVRAAVGKALSAVPGAVGVNNHMGSRFTELREPMEWVMDELRARDLYFLDSATSGRTVAAESARAAGVSWAKRDVFLDNEHNVEAVGRQIELALRRAERHGSAIAIGHPHGTTLEALKIWGPRMQEAGVQVVPLGQLVARPTG